MKTSTTKLSGASFRKAVCRVFIGSYHITVSLSPSVGEKVIVLVSIQSTIKTFIWLDRETKGNLSGITFSSFLFV